MRTRWDKNVNTNSSYKLSCVHLNSLVPKLDVCDPFWTKLWGTNSFKDNFMLFKGSLHITFKVFWTNILLIKKMQYFSVLNAAKIGPYMQFWYQTFSIKALLLPVLITIFRLLLVNLLSMKSRTVLMPVFKTNWYLSIPANGRM